jgi:hypothetical protein
VFAKGLEYIPEGTRQEENLRELTSLSVLAFVPRKVTDKEGSLGPWSPLYILAAEEALALFRKPQIFPVCTPTTT